MGIVIESMTVGGQQLNNDNEYDTSSSVTTNEGVLAAYRRPTGNFNGKYRKVLKVRKDTNQQSLPVVRSRVNKPSNSEDSVSASSNKNSFTVNNYDDNDEYFSRRRARFLFRQRVGK